MTNRCYSHVKQQKAIKAAEEHICVVCWADDKKHARGHHLIPFSEDGPASLSNFVTLCNDCHKKYHAKKLNIDLYRF